MDGVIETRGLSPSRFGVLALRHHPGCVSEVAQRWTLGERGKQRGE
jgi:hypothetical protein